MQIRFAGQQGSALLISMMISGVIGVALASFLTLVRFQNDTTMRSMQWNSAIPVAEAGIEEALTHIHHNGITNLGINGWTLVNGDYVKKYYLDENYYEVSITPVDPPIIVSRGYMRDLWHTRHLPPRVVRATTKHDFYFVKGLVAQGQIDLLGNNVRTDSFDSADPNHSTNGRYDKDKHKDNGDVATNSGVIDSLNIWNADIKGKVATGPGGNVKIGAKGTVGSKNWVDAGTVGVEPGWSHDDMNVSFQDVEPPFTSGYSSPAGGTVGGTNYTYVVGNGNYQMSNLSLSSENTMLINGHATLYVTGEVEITGQAKIVIAPGASLKLYVAGQVTKLSGKGIVNEGGNALNFLYYGLPSNKQIEFTGNAEFIGAIYAPSAHLKLGGGGSTQYDFMGASISASAVMNGHFNYHYDENLGKLGPDKGFVVTGWNEI